MAGRLGDLNIQQILKELEVNTGVFPRQAVVEAMANREQITPELLRILEHAEQNLEELVERSGYMAHIYAMFLLAQFRETEAYPLIVKFFSIPGEVTLDLTGDVVTEYLGRILASVSGGDISLMTELAENARANEFVRDAALDGMVTLVARGERSRQEIMAYFQSLFRGKLVRKYSHVWGGLVNVCVDLYPEEVLEDIRQAFEDHLVDNFLIDFDFVEEVLAQGKEKVLEDLRTGKRHQYIGNTVSEMEWWACFKPAPARLAAREKKAGRSYPYPSGSGKKYKSTPVRLTAREKKKVGRNDPCPCGSGKKYKRCCGRLA